MVIRTMRCANTIGSALTRRGRRRVRRQLPTRVRRRPASRTASLSAASSQSTDAALARVCVAGSIRDSRRVIWRRTESGVVAPATSPARIASATATTRIRVASRLHQDGLRQVRVDVAVGKSVGKQRAHRGLAEVGRTDRRPDPPHPIGAQSKVSRRQDRRGESPLLPPLECRRFGRRGRPGSGARNRRPTARRRPAPPPAAVQRC